MKVFNLLGYQLNPS